MICSSPELRKQEIQHLKQVFYEKNDYQEQVIRLQNKLKQNNKYNNVIHSNNLTMDNFEQPSTTSEEKAMLLIPHQEQKDDFTTKSMRKRLKTLLPNNFNTQIAFKVRNLIHLLKSKTVNFENKHNLVYHGKCPANNFNSDYIGEIGQCI